MSRTIVHAHHDPRGYGWKHDLARLTARKDYRRGGTAPLDIDQEVDTMPTPTPTAPTFTFDPFAEVRLADLAEAVSAARAANIVSTRYDLDFDAECGWAAPTAYVASDWHDNSVYEDAE